MKGKGAPAFAAHFMGQWQGHVVGLCLLALCAVAFGAAQAAEDYVLGPEDVISVTVWEHPELSRTSVVRANGTVTVPPIGDLMAAGKTTALLARELEKQFYNNLRITTQATVTVVAFNSRKVFLAGQVMTPGRYAFETLPDILDLLGQAGGLGAGGDLSAVRILRRGESGETSIPVDVNHAIQQGDLSGLPRLQSGDVVFVPASATSANVGTGGIDAVYVVGEVLRPGTYSASGGLTLAQILGVAGGATVSADLSNISVISEGDGSGSYVLRANLARELEAGRSGPEVRGGDTVIVPSRDAGIGRQTWGVVKSGLSASKDILNLILIRDGLKDN